MGLGPGREDPRLLDWAARGGRRLLGLRTPASRRPGCLWPLCTPSVTLTLLGVSERDALPRQSGGSCGLGAGEAEWCRGLTLSDPAKLTPRVPRKEAGHPSEQLEPPAVPSTGSRRRELRYIHSGDSHPAAQKEDGDC